MGDATIVNDFCDFKVHSLGDDHVFLHINCGSPQLFYASFAEYFFTEDKLLRYTENNQHLSFSPTTRNYATLYRHLRLYIDDFNLYRIAAEECRDLTDIVNDEFDIEDIDQDPIVARNSTIGRFGEYFLHILLSEYFEFDCIIPKVNLTTNRNMSVFGIDSLFYSSKNDMIMFGESKLTKSLSSGIKLINRSLENYEKQIREEFLLVLSSRLIESNADFCARFGKDLSESFSVEEFIQKANVQSIGVPLFIAHGQDDSASEILKGLQTLNHGNLLGLKTIYISLSLPILNKHDLVTHLTNYIQDKILEYQGA